MGYHLGHNFNVQSSLLIQTKCVSLAAYACLLPQGSSWHVKREFRGTSQALLPCLFAYSSGWLNIYLEHLIYFFDIVQYTTHSSFGKVKPIRAAGHRGTECRCFLVKMTNVLYTFHQKEKEQGARIRSILASSADEPYLWWTMLFIMVLIRPAS